MLFFSWLGFQYVVRGMWPLLWARLFPDRMCSLFCSGCQLVYSWNQPRFQSTRELNSAWHSHSHVDGGAGLGIPNQVLKSHFPIGISKKWVGLRLSSKGQFMKTVNIPKGATIQQRNQEANSTLWPATETHVPEAMPSETLQVQHGHAAPMDMNSKIELYSDKQQTSFPLTAAEPLVMP